MLSSRALLNEWHYADAVGLCTLLARIHRPLRKHALANYGQHDARRVNAHRTTNHMRTTIQLRSTLPLHTLPTITTTFNTVAY